jgi:hydrogenase-4 component F
MLVTSAFPRQPLLTVTLVIGLLIAAGAIILRLQDIVFGEPRGPKDPAKASFIPLFTHLTIVLVAGVWLPGPIVRWFQLVAAQLG